MTRVLQQTRAEARVAQVAKKLQGMFLRSIPFVLRRCLSALSRELARNYSGESTFAVNLKRGALAPGHPLSLIPMAPRGLWLRTGWVGCGRRSKSRRYCAPGASDKPGLPVSHEIIYTATYAHPKVEATLAPFALTAVFVSSSELAMFWYAPEATSIG